MKPTDDAQRPTAGELMSDQESAARDEGSESMAHDEARELARKHQEAVAEGRARVGEAPPDVGANAESPKRSIHPGGG